MTVDVVVVNYHTEADLQRFLDSFDHRGPKDDYTLTVIDVEAGPYLETMNDFQHGRRIGLAENVGYARACNFASLLHDHEVLAFFNADVALLNAGSIERCVEALMANERWGVLGPRQINAAGKLTHAGIFGTHAHPQLRGWQERSMLQYQDIEKAISVSGSAYFVKRACWDELTNCETYLEVAPDAAGAFLPTPHYYEETWVSYHADAHGWDVMYFGEETFRHEWHQASVVGGWAEQQMPTSRKLFREACDHHGIDHD